MCPISSLTMEIIIKVMSRAASRLTLYVKEFKVKTEIIDAINFRDKNQ